MNRRRPAAAPPPLEPPPADWRPFYLCDCGARFPLTLGKYGCPNCCADEGPARVAWTNGEPPRSEAAE